MEGCLLCFYDMFLCLFYSSIELKKTSSQDLCWLYGNDTMEIRLNFLPAALLYFMSTLSTHLLKNAL